ncbi:cache domain-containing protein, partial [Rhizobium helianthi]
MKRLSIPTQLAILVGGLIFAFSIAAFLQIRSSSDAIYKQRYELLRTEVETGMSVLQAFYEREKSGELTREQAQKQAYALITKMRFEPDGYFFAYDFDVVMVLHPNPKLVGVSSKGKPDSAGFAYRDEIVRVARAGGGYVEFLGPKPNVGQNDYVFPKTSYNKVFEPWSIVLSTGLYTDDLAAEIRATTIKVLSAGLIILLFAVLVAYVIIRGITRPLSAIHDALGAVADE